MLDRKGPNTISEYVIFIAFPASQKPLNFTLWYSGCPTHYSLRFPLLYWLLSKGNN